MTPPKSVTGSLHIAAHMRRGQVPHDINPRLTIMDQRRSACRSPADPGQPTRVQIGITHVGRVAIGADPQMIEIPGFRIADCSPISTAV